MYSTLLNGRVIFILHSERSDHSSLFIYLSFSLGNITSSTSLDPASAGQGVE